MRTMEMLLHSLPIATCSFSGNGWSEDRQRSRQEGVDLARRALQAAGDDPNVLAYVAYVHGYFEPTLNLSVSGTHVGGARALHLRN